MKYDFFYSLAVKLNDINKGDFTAEELEGFANDYLIEYNDSIEQGAPTHTMKSLCEEITGEEVEGLTIEAMKNILINF